MGMRYSGVTEVSLAPSSNDGWVREGTWRNMGWINILVERDEPRHEETKPVKCVQRLPFGGLESSFSAPQEMAAHTLLKP
jgi:hypothetical protein